MSDVELLARKATDDLDMSELKERALWYFRNGKIDISWKGQVLGFGGTINRGREPSKDMLKIIRRLVWECRCEDGTEPVDFIDDDDVDQPAPKIETREQMWAEF